MSDKQEKALSDETTQSAPEDSFYFWLVATGVTLFILMLFYIQKTNGMM